MSRMRLCVTSSAATLVAALLAVTGCGTSTSDKAAGTHHKPVVLTMANASFSPRDLEAFADAVAERSGGTVHIRLANNWRWGQRDFEPGAIRDVKAAKVVDMGWVGSRAFDELAVTSFDALHAPFAIDSYALEQAVLQSRIPDRMLAGLTPLGVVGLGVLPGPLRRPLSAPRPLRTLGFQGAAEPADALRAFGARPVRLVSGARWHGTTRSSSTSPRSMPTATTTTPATSRPMWSSGRERWCCS